jgi:hypothetical protein
MAGIKSLKESNISPFLNFFERLRLSTATSDMHPPKYSPQTGVPIV